MNRMFAAPFLTDLGQGHVDGVYSMAKDPNSLERLASGAGDGVVKVWDLASRDKAEAWHTTAHENIVKSVCWTRDRKLLTAGTDRTIKLFDPYNTPSASAPISTWLGSSSFSSLSHHRSRNVFAAAGGSAGISIYGQHLIMGLGRSPY